MDLPFADVGMSEIFSERAGIAAWLEVEVALARAQADAGVLTAADAEEIEAAANVLVVDRADLWDRMRLVGYPILPLVRMLDDSLRGHAAGRVHLGATTQDIMDTGQALQLRRALRRLEQLTSGFGDAIAGLVRSHAATVMPGRTHGQHAVPITFGSKMAVYLEELAQHRARLREGEPRIARVSLFGAAGTAAALGPSASEIRSHLARHLGLYDADIPWHVNRAGIYEFGVLCTFVSATAARFAREVIELARTEIDEVREAPGHHRGASSTMPQKANPVRSEMIVAMSAVAGSLLPALHQAAQPRHERAAGEWQIEWIVVPQLARLAASAIATAGDVAGELVVDSAHMSENLDCDGGLIMAEAYMMRLAPFVGRERAHDLIYEVATGSRRQHLTLIESLRQLDSEVVRMLSADGALPMAPHEYLGESELLCARALAAWERAASAPTRTG